MTLFLRSIMLMMVVGMIGLFQHNAAYALMANDILSKNGSPEETGEAIAKEVDDRDLGFDDSVNEIEMILRNATGDESRREMRTQTLENTAPDDGDKSLTVFDKPRDVKGTALLSFAHFLDSDDQWLYLPALKRVKRISSRNKSGPFMGSEFSYEDMTATEMAKYTYKYIRSEDCGDLQCFVVERFPKYENSGYTKQIAWIDQDEFRIQKVEFYDRKNELLKTLTLADYHQYLGKYWRAHDMYMVNHQTNKTTRLLTRDYKFKTGLDENDFNQAVLKRTR